MHGDGLRKHMIATYANMRLGIGLVAILFPVLLYVGGKFHEIGLQGSMSAYYHAGEGAMRDVFVGILFGLSLVLYLYKGYSQRENVALNVASVLGVGVALFPMEWPEGGGVSIFTAHGLCAVGLFLCIAYVCLFRAVDTLPLLPERRRKRYARTYRTQGVLMVISPLAAWVTDGPRISERVVALAPQEESHGGQPSEVARAGAGPAIVSGRPAQLCYAALPASMARSRS